MKEKLKKKGREEKWRGGKGKGMEGGKKWAMARAAKIPTTNQQT
jgi:hypothetical protein